MPKSCCVPKCKTGKKSLGVKRSVFKVPKNEVLRKQWEAAIPGVTSLKENQFVCERHFLSNLIKKKFVKYDAEGKLIAEALLAHPRLQANAVPTIFISEDEPMGSLNIREETASTLHVMTHTPTATVEQHNVSLFNVCKSPLEIDHPIKEKSPSSDIERVTDSNGPDNGPFHSEPSPEDLSQHQTIAKLQIISTTCVGDENVSINLPRPWSVTRSTTKSGTIFVFCHISTSTDKDVTNVEVTKYVVFESWSGRIQYYVYGKLVHVEDQRLPHILHEASSLLVTLIAFEKMRVCKGVGFIDVSVLKDEGFQDFSKSWHHHRCTLLTKKMKCENCKKMKNTIWRREQRLAKGTLTRRISSVCNPLDRLKLNALKKKLANQKRSKNRAKRRITLLKNSLEQQEAAIAALTTESFEKKCSSFNVPETQKITLREIMTAAKTNSNGRRYSKDWLMLCMLMNIRGPSYYEFLRKNNVVPLPCTRTIRHYYSMIDKKCGFDPNFAQLLSKRLVAKKPMQRQNKLIIGNRSQLTRKI